MSRATAAARDRDHRRLTPGPNLCGISDIGRVRKRNEDDLYAHADASILVVADGLGGMPAGDVASRVAVEAVVAALAPAAGRISDDAAARVCLRAAFDEAQDRVLEAGRQRRPPVEIGTALVVGSIRADTFYVGHVGDVRAYRMSRGRLIQLTEDHTRVGDLVTLGILDEESARRHPERHVLNQCLGIDAGVAPSFRAERLLVGDLLLLCSDGLWESMSASALADLMRKPRQNLLELAEAVVAVALDAGGRDNITAVFYEHGPPQRGA